MADRIQARAVKQCGRLLKEIEKAHGANQNIGEGDCPKVTRTQAARDAGMSDHQRKTALRVANIPEEYSRVNCPTPLTCLTFLTCVQSMTAK